jgi:hypothetical protein
LIEFLENHQKIFTFGSEAFLMELSFNGTNPSELPAFLFRLEILYEDETERLKNALLSLDDIALQWVLECKSKF